MTAMEKKETIDVSSKIEKVLSETPYNKYRKSLDKSHGYLFDSQIDAAKDLVMSLGRQVTRRNHVVLAAKMQSGKTGVCNALVNIVMQTPIYRWLAIDKFMFITGMNDCGLKEQTKKRIEEQVIGANEENIYIGKRSEKYAKLGVRQMFYVLKNSDLKKFNGSIDNSVIMIDEAHYGSNEKNILSQFLYKQGIDWKDSNSLISRNIYIVSVSATPFDEIVSDTKKVKQIVELKTSKGYTGVTEMIRRGQVEDSFSDDITEGGRIFDLIDDACSRMERNDEYGIMIIRSLKSNVILGEKRYLKMFNILELNSSGSKIDYQRFNDACLELVRINRFNEALKKGGSNCVTASGPLKGKPLMVLVKGAFRAGITVPEEIKRYIYMVFDHSVKADTTAQALMGRLCGYASKVNKNTNVYVNAKYAKMYSAWENDFQNRSIVPCSSTTEQWIPNDVKDSRAVIASRNAGNVSVDLTDIEVHDIYVNAKKFKSRVTFMKMELPKILAKHGIGLKYDYIGEAVLSGKNNYVRSSQIRRFENFSDSATPYMFRPERVPEFVAKTGRNTLSRRDLGLRAVYVVLDATVDERNPWNIGGNKRLLLYNVEVGQKIDVPNVMSLYRKHKDTDLSVV